MLKAISFILFLWILIPLNAQESDGFDTFLTEFKTAIKQKDKNKVAELTQFPLVGYDFPFDAGLPSGSNELDKETFLKGYSKIFTSKRVKTLLQREPVKTDLYGEEVESYTLVFTSAKTYSSWLVFMKNDSGDWKLVYTDNVSYE
jgi:hypothetical protein